MIAANLSAPAPGRQDRLLGTVQNGVIWFTWHLLAAVCIPLVLSEIRLSMPFWQMSTPVRLFLLGLALTHLLVTAILSLLAFRRGTIGLPSVFLAVAVAYGTLFVLLRFTDLTYSRSLLIMAAGASFVFASLSAEMMTGLYRVLLPALVIASAGMAQVAFAGWPADDGVKGTTFYSVKLVDTGMVVPSSIRGGAIKVLGKGFLVASAEGGLYYAADGPTFGAAGLRRLRYDIPLHRNEYKADHPDNTFSNDPFRVTDILVEEANDRVRLIAAHHYWKSDDRCVGLRVSMTDASQAALLDGSADLAWKTLYDSQPCLKLVDIRYEQSGGMLTRLDDRSLLLTTGDHNLDGYYAHTSAPQDPAFQYGKTIRIDTETGAAKVFTLGHRNPQGVLKAPDGRLWETEQGPAGGDELNLLKEGSNYGWPLVTYGAAYDKHTWPPNAHNGFHLGFVEPFFAWLPSIAVTNILSIHGNLFPIWKGDLLVSSLKGFVMRLRVNDERVIFDEPILAANIRIRGMTEAPDGRIFLFQDEGAISYIDRVQLPIDSESDTEGGAAPIDPGEVRFRACQDCHRIGSGTDHAAGPDLRGIVGRNIASAPRFDYSPALKSLPGSWTADTLNRFLENPQQFAPGTSMQMEGIENADARRQLIEYLATRK